MHAFLDPIINFIHGDGLVVLPQMELLLFALGILVFDVLLEEHEKHFNAYLALAGIAASALGLFMQFKKYDGINNASAMGGQVLGFSNTVIIDTFSLFFSILFLATAALVILLSVRYLDIEQEQRGVYYSLILLASVGMMLIVNGLDVIVLLLGLETMSFSLYFLTGFVRREKRSAAGALKYFTFGAFSTAILMYGFSLLYGVSSSTNIIQIGDILDKRLRYTSTHGLYDWVVILAFAIISVGMCFKLAAVPFPLWAAEVFEAAPTPVSAYVSVAFLVAGFALFLRILVSVFSASQGTWFRAVAAVAIVSLLLGNFAALTQTNLKRLLAYSSIAQLGFILLGLVAWNEPGLVGVFYSLIAYTFMTLGAFAILVILHERGQFGPELSDLDGLYDRSPALALLLLLFLLSLAGIPATAGFLGKYFILKALFQSQHKALAVLAVVLLLPAFYNYFRVVAHAWKKSPGTQSFIPVIATAELFALIFTAFVTLAAGLYPEPFKHLVHYALGQ